MSDANRISIAYVEETTYGVIPAGPPDLKRVRITGEGLGQDTTFSQSQELRDDRQVGDQIRTDVSGSGPLNFELSYSAFDDFLEAVFLSADWAAAVTQNNVANVTAAAAGNTLTRAAGSWIVDGYLVGKWVKITGGVANAGTLWGKITALTATVMTLAYVTLVDEGPISTFDFVQGGYIENGTTFRSFSMERRYNDNVNDYARYRGVVLDSLALTVAADGIITGNFGTLSAREESATATFGDGADTAAPTNSVLNAIDHVKALFEGGASYKATNFAVNLANNHRVRKVIGVLGADSIGTGTLTLSGSLTAYYSSPAVIDKYLGDTPSSLALRILDPAGNAYILEIPRVKYSNGRRVGGGINQDVVAAMDWVAYMHPTELKTARLSRWPAA